MLNKEGDDPYAIFVDSVCAWLLCWKRFREKDPRYDKNVGLKIAKMMYVDFRNTDLLVREHPVGYTWIKRGWFFGYARYRKPCPRCFRPSFVKERCVGEFIKYTTKCEKNHKVCIANLDIQTVMQFPFFFPNCLCTLKVTCFVCAEKLAKANNWILPV